MSRFAPAVLRRRREQRGDCFEPRDDVRLRALPAPSMSKERESDRALPPHMTHPTEDELAQYAFAPDAAGAREIEMHVAACPRCRAKLAFIRTVDAGMGDSDA